MQGTEKQIEAITTHHQSLVVTAGAGTGKTHVLVHKYLHLLETFGERTHGSSRLSVQNILALTFTDKAAAEMKERIRSALEEKDGPYWERTRLEFLIAPVQTFHSFCANVLREYAFEAGIEPSFVVLDGQDSSRIFSTSYDLLIHSPVQDGDDDAIVKTLAMVGSFALEQIIRYLYARREETELFFSRFSDEKESVMQKWQDAIFLFRKDEAERLQNNPDFVSAVQSLLSFALMDVPSDDKAMVYLQDVLPYLQILLGPSDTDEFLDAAVSYGKRKMGNVGSKKVWGEQESVDLKGAYKTLNKYLKGIDTVAQLSFHPDEPFDSITLQFLQSLALTFRRFCEIIDKEKAAVGGMDFTDLIRHTRQLFRTHRDTIAGEYAERFRYILIDEFQDTDPAQFEIVRTIIGEPAPDVSSLFIVGDPKQSIYLFRQADVTRFNEARELITTGCSGKEIPLDVCFRSSPAVISFVNILFSRLFESTEKPWEFPYNAISVSDERGEHTGSVELILIREESGLEEHEVIADKIMEIIREGTEIYEEGIRDTDGKRTFLKRPATCGDIAILLERRTHLGLYLHALAQRKIPYYVHKGTGLYKRQEILDFISLISFLHHPYDDLHLFGLLRSPYFGLPDTTLCHISRFSGQTFLEKLHHSVDSFPEHERICTLLMTWLSRAGRYRLSPLIQSVFDESGVLAVYGGMTEGEQILSNLDKLISIISSREEGGRYGLSDLAYDLAESVDREEDEGEAMIDDPDLNAVIIMTVHASKGLEFPIVFVPDMSSAPNLQHGPVLMDTEGIFLGLHLPHPDKDFEKKATPVYYLLKHNLDEKLIAEKRRLLYVALTRSADHLIMSGKIKESLPDGSKPTRLDWIISALGITDHSIREGSVVLSSDSGEEVVLRIVTPEPGILASAEPEPPFTIREELRNAHGRYVQNQIGRMPPQFQPLKVTDVSHPVFQMDDTSEWTNEVGNTQFGSAIHEVLRGRDPAVIMKEFGIIQEDEQHLLASVYNTFWSLPELTDTLQVKRELAFTAPVAGKILTGRMDLIVQCPDGSWLVIDYKSDRISAEELLKKEYYLVQVEIYRRAAEIMGMTPVRGALYSVNENRLLLIDPFPEEQLNAFIRSSEQENQNSGISNDS